MRLQGLNKPNYIPKNKITVPYVIQQHKYGAIATWSHCTDRYLPDNHAVDAEIHGFKYNLALTSFISNNINGGGQVASDFKDVAATGRIGFGTYEFTGQAHYVDDGINTKESMDTQYLNIKNGLGYYPSVGSYAHGRQTFRNDLKDYYLGVRNSNYDLSNYNYDIQDTSSFPTTTRQADMVGDRNLVLNQVGQSLEDAIINGGWFRDFTHWHTVTDGNLDEFFKHQRTIIDNRKVASLSFMEAVEYMKLRQKIMEIRFFEANGKIYVTTELPYESIMRRNINTEISVEVDLTGTILESKELKSSYGLQKIGVDKFIVEVPINDYAILEEDVSGDYLDFNLPNLTAIADNEFIKIETNKPTNVVIFGTSADEPLHTAEILKRSNNMSKEHEIKLTEINYDLKDIYFGAITKERQSILSSKYNF